MRNLAPVRLIIEDIKVELVAHICLFAPQAVEVLSSPGILRLTTTKRQKVQQVMLL